MKAMKIFRLGAAAIAIALLGGVLLSSVQPDALEPLPKGYCWVSTPTGGYDGCTAGASLQCEHTNGCPAT